jgi:hypothetical protein
MRRGSEKIFAVLTLKKCTREFLQNLSRLAVYQAIAILPSM